MTGPPWWARLAGARPQLRTLVIPGGALRPGCAGWRPVCFGGHQKAPWFQPRGHQAGPAGRSGPVLVLKLASPSRQTCSAALAARCRDRAPFRNSASCTEDGIEHRARLVGQIVLGFPGSSFPSQPGPRPPSHARRRRHRLRSSPPFTSLAFHLPRFLLCVNVSLRHTGHSYGIRQLWLCSQRERLPLSQNRALAGQDQLASWPARGQSLSRCGGDSPQRTPLAATNCWTSAPTGCWRRT